MGNPSVPNKNPPPVSLIFRRGRRFVIRSTGSYMYAGAPWHATDVAGGGAARRLTAEGARHEVAVGMVAPVAHVEVPVWRAVRTFVRVGVTVIRVLPGVASRPAWPKSLRTCTTNRTSNARRSGQRTFGMHRGRSIIFKFPCGPCPGPSSTRQ